MRDAGIGRVLVAALHQAIADVLPDRLDFYENWLDAKGLRDGTIGLAPLAAVLSFLRTEGAHYETVTRRAGAYAAEWTIAELSPLRRRVIATSPMFLRRTLALRLARRLVSQSYTGSRASVRIRRGIGGVDIKSSIFCGVRDRTTQPLCYFYASAFAATLRHLDVAASTAVTACQAEGSPSCHVEVRLDGAAEPSAEDSIDMQGAPAA
jgi:predicted hydrocarbon binding protein